MTRSKGSRIRLSGLLALALGAIALLALPSLAAAKDRNHDRIPDRWEKRHKLSLKVNQARKDQDRDHMRNLAEFKASFNPRDADTDNDGIEDGEENAGTIASFDPETGKLTINLFGGDTITGVVSEGTEIECGGGGSDNSGASASSEDNSGSSESGEDSSEGEDQSGEDGPSHDATDDSSEEGDHSGSDSSGGGEGSSNCTTADLVPGAVVEEAELKLENGVATYEKIELGDKEDGSTTS